MHTQTNTPSITLHLFSALDFFAPGVAVSRIGLNALWAACSCVCVRCWFQRWTHINLLTLVLQSVFFPLQICAFWHFLLFMTAGSWKKPLCAGCWVRVQRKLVKYSFFASSLHWHWAMGMLRPPACRPNDLMRRPFNHVAWQSQCSA